MKATWRTGLTLLMVIYLSILSPAVYGQRIVEPPGLHPPTPEAQAVQPPPINSALPPIREGEFVTRSGSRLLLGNQPFRFAGNNAYFLQPEIVYNNLAGVRETLDKMASLGLSVARTIGYNDHPPEANDPAVIQIMPGVFREINLMALDRAVAEAKARNIRLILNLTNNWTAYGGIRRYVFWYLNREPTRAEWGLFYTNETVKGWFKNYVSMLLNRANTVTGIKYKDEPAILAWELGNELRNPSPGGADALIAWMTEMSAFIKRLDPNHLVADGGEGFDDDRSLWPGLSNGYAVSGSEGCSFHRLVHIPDIDMVSYHLYPAFWGLNDTTDVEVWIRGHERMARAAGKVAYLGEYGKRAADQSPPGCSREPGRQFDPLRAQIFDQWLKWAVVEEGTAGQMVWQLIYDRRDDCEGFQVYCPLDSATCAILQKYAEGVNDLPLAVLLTTRSVRR
jgi:mannan endo-1,4-beta-mannosidase